LREAGLDDAAIEAAARDALAAAGFRLGEGGRPHDARVSVAAVRLVSGGAGGGPRAQVAVELALAPAQAERAAPRTETGTGSCALSDAATPREAWLVAFTKATRSAGESLALGFAADERTVEALVSDLASKDARVREHAIRVLGERRSREAVPPLIGRLADDDPRLVERAAAALAQIGDERAVPALIDHSRMAIAHGQGTRLLRYMGDIGGAEAEGYLLTIEAGHADPQIRAAARAALDDLAARKKDAVAARK
jgi:hypothetical protein